MSKKTKKNPESEEAKQARLAELRKELQDGKPNLEEDTDVEITPVASGKFNTSMDKPVRIPTSPLSREPAPELTSQDLTRLTNWALGNQEISPEEIAKLFRGHAGRALVYSALGITGRIQRLQELSFGASSVEDELNRRIANMSTAELMRLRDARATDIYRHLAKMAPDASIIDNLTGQGGLASMLSGKADGTAENPIPVGVRENLVRLGEKFRTALIAMQGEDEDGSKSNILESGNESNTEQNRQSEAVEGEVLQAGRQEKK